MTIRNIRTMFAALLLALLVCFGAVMGGQGFLSAFAATDVQTAYENTNVLDNLEGSTIGGKEFDIADYPHNDSGKPQIISLVEFCYSYYADKQEDFGLYVYVYNPQDIALDMGTGTKFSLHMGTSRAIPSTHWNFSTTPKGRATRAGSISSKYACWMPSGWIF